MDIFVKRPVIAIVISLALLLAGNLGCSEHPRPPVPEARELEPRRFDDPSGRLG